MIFQEFGWIHLQCYQYQANHKIPDKRLPGQRSSTNDKHSLQRQGNLNLHRRNYGADEVKLAVVL